MMAEIFNNFDRRTEKRFMTALEEHNRESAERIKALMFTFEDLGKLDPGSAQTLLRHVEKDRLAVALKGATERCASSSSNMSTRAAKMLPRTWKQWARCVSAKSTRRRLMVNVAKDLADKGEIMITKGSGEEELVY